MSAKYLVFIAACYLLACTQVSGQGVQVIDGKIKITIGTASGCSDTVRFFDHLVEANRLYGDFLDIEFVPWGRTRLSDDGEFWCQFGEVDCWANRLHRCVLKMLEGDQEAQVQYMSCEFYGAFGPAFTQGTYACAQAIGVNLIDVDYCVAHPGDELDKQTQEKAVLPIQVINFVPYIMFGGVPDEAVSHEARATLTSMICFALAADPSTGVTRCQIQ